MLQCQICPIILKFPHIPHAPQSWALSLDLSVGFVCAVSAAPNIHAVLKQTPSQ